MVLREHQSRRGEWEGKGRDDYYGRDERRDWQDRRMDDRRDFSHEEDRRDRDRRPDDRGYRG